MTDDDVDPRPEIRRLVLLNATAADMNFALLARPGSFEGIPDNPVLGMLAWKVALVPGQSEGVSSRHHFLWAERQAFVLGRLGRGQAPGFLPEAILPIPDRHGTTFTVGFVGTVRNGASKLLRSETGNTQVAALHTDGSFPSLRERTGATSDLAVALAVDPDEDGNGGALTMTLEPNSMVTLARSPEYWIVPVRPEVMAGDPIPSDMVAAAHGLDFQAAVTLRLTYTDRNVFVST